MIVTVTEGITPAHLIDIYSDSYISRIGHDHRCAAPVIHPNVTYISAWIGDTFAGAFMAIKQSAIEFELHALLKKKSIRHSRELGRKFLEWAFSHPILRVTAYIIEGLEAAKNYCIKLGFKEEGCRRNACVKNGIAKDVYILGLIREEWSAT